ncbi:MAG: peptidoglycan editing factor PgeF [Butyrivibrio sp.]|uniref:peptidoglycan editing factor PgeF n=1 Tax=Butyrivibrio sp. TaxID=28121 RepID=UPI0025F5B492|nr:peptidoglycan editing factor PgeF [Butyrivibrio sp.]MCR5770896.1 peptidoglycan editing factor PgeF [Butyrivibrio sp.]
MEKIVRKGHEAVMEQHIHENGMEYLTFPKLDATGIVSHAFSTRIGGASKGYFSQTNFSFTRGDNKEDVEENYKRMAQILGYGRSLEHFVTTFQTHTTNIMRIKAEDMGKGVCKDRNYVDVDGMITNEPGIILTTFHADCPPVYFVDPVNKAIGLSHSGWKGTVGRIGARTIEAMNREFGTKPSDLICAIGPSICTDCYEVSSDVAEKFIEEFKLEDIPEYDIESVNSEVNNKSSYIQNNKTDDNPLHSLNGKDIDKLPHILYKKENGKYQLNLWEAIRITLLEAGAYKDNISITDVCTKCNPDYLFSHRIAGEKRGNLAAFLVLNT